jgi:hypothetical protein
MTTQTGIAHCLQRMHDCPDLGALRRVWQNLGVAYQREPVILQAKERLKETLPKVSD